jgi:AAA+ ATPase superfamily predicted ATPase
MEVGGAPPAADLRLKAKYPLPRTSGPSFLRINLAILRGNLPKAFQNRLSHLYARQNFSLKTQIGEISPACKK